MEDYLVTLIEPVRSNLIRLRLSNHKMPIETGRHIGIDRNDRLCNICKSSDIGDEYHYFCICVAVEVLGIITRMGHSIPMHVFVHVGQTRSL